MFVLHCFQKKSKSGIATPKQDMEIIRARLKVAEAMAKEMRNGKARHRRHRSRDQRGQRLRRPGPTRCGKAQDRVRAGVEVTRAIRNLGLTQEEAGRRMGIPQPKVSAMLRGDFSNLSERKLMDCLNRLGYDIEIKVRPAAEPVGHVTLAVA